MYNVNYLFPVLYCTLLKIAQTEKDKALLKEKMKQDPVLAKLLNQLEGTSVEESSSKVSQSQRDAQKAEILGMDTAGQVCSIVLFKF